METPGPSLGVFAFLWRQRGPSVLPQVECWDLIFYAGAGRSCFQRGVLSLQGFSPY